jgi:CRISPR-associated protein Cmr5
MTTERASGTTSRRRTLEQERAAAAWRAVMEVKDTGFAKEYRSLALSGPADIQANGLGQALAFWRAKGYEQGKAKTGSEHAELYRHVTGWVCRQLRIPEAEDLLTWVMGTAGTDAYRRATAEAIAFLGWVKRFAEAELPSGGDRS